MSLKDCRDKDGNLIAYAFPGGYQMLYFDANSEPLCPDCARKADDARRFLKAYNEAAHHALIAQLYAREQQLVQIRAGSFTGVPDAWGVNQSIDGQRVWMHETDELRAEIARIYRELAVAKENESEYPPVHGYIFEEGAPEFCSVCNTQVESVYGDPAEDEIVVDG